jgi:hypothetical protein
MSTQKRGHSAGRKKSGAGNRRGSGKSSRTVEQIGTSRLDLEPRRLEITVTVPTPSPNEWVRAHWSTYAKIKKAWMSRIHAASIRHCGTGLFGKPIAHASLTIERMGVRELDQDNLVGGMKPIIDCLIKLGFLENDTPDVIQQMDVYQTLVGTKAAQGARITIRERIQETG